MTLTNSTKNKTKGIENKDSKHWKPKSKKRKRVSARAITSIIIHSMETKQLVPNQNHFSKTRSRLGRIYSKLVRNKTILCYRTR